MPLIATRYTKIIVTTKRLSVPNICEMIRVWFFVSALLFCVVRAHTVDGDPLGEGEPCEIGGLLHPRSCGTGLTCVVQDLGNISVDAPATGECTVVEDEPNECSVVLCTKGGADAICEVEGLVATCEAWATREDGGPSAQCPEQCIQICLAKQLVASNGEMFCNVCLLRIASCESNFKIFGPVKNVDDGPLGEGEPCEIGGLLLPRSCGTGLTCVVQDLGNISVDAPATGECTVVEDELNECSVVLCTKGGADAICEVEGLVATCEAWATREDGGTSAQCPEQCIQDCLTKRLVASNGEMFCNMCLLRIASCESNFKIFGPVENAKPKCDKPISVFDAAECCREKGIECIKRGGVCSTSGSRIPSVPCEKGLTCVIRDFGFPAADRPNSGKCQRLVRRVRKCSVKRCSRFGGRYVCKVPVPPRSGVVSTCKAWARRSDGTAGPDCGFFCALFCRIKHKPVASNGKKFCSICQLRQASCASDFKIFGPVKRK